ncbi:MAG: adenylate/guanylate cyclase domain-containing protein [bacterium]
MRLFDRVFTYLFPLSLLEPTPWLDMWKEKERNDFVSAVRIFFPIAAALYLAHYWLFDLPMGLEPGVNWLLFRVSMVLIAVLALIYYWLPLHKVRAYRAVAVVATTIFSVSQSWVTVFYPAAPWLYCFVFVVVSALILRTSVIKSTAFALVIIALQWPALMRAGLAVPEVVSASGVTLLALVVLRGAYLADVRYFLLNQQNIDAQRRNIELNIEFTDRIKSFIPGQIANRLERYLKYRGTSVVSAIYEVLRPRKLEIACLFSDIRGFTEGSKDLDAFISESVLPNLKACTDAVEINGGIPRKIGDLMFAYFDYPSVHLNLLRAILSGLEIARINSDLNVTNANSGHSEIERFILISVGEAIVGNIGGFDSSVEITALGSPVNFLSRLDEATKHPELRKRLESSDLLLCDRSLSLLKEMGVYPTVVSLDLEDLGVSIRNFPDTTVVHAMRPSERNRDLIRTFFDRLKEEGLTGDEDRSEAA